MGTNTPNGADRVPLSRRTQGTMSALTSTFMFDSASRLQMASIQAGQAIVPHKSDLPRMLTGLEDQLAQYTFGVRAPCELRVLKVINKYNVQLGLGRIKSNPLTTVIYINMDPDGGGEYGCFHMEQYQNQTERVHETFGFKYVLTEKAKNIHENMCLRKGELLTHSPNIDEHGLYSTGISANVAYISTPATIEDGFDVSDELLERARPMATGSRVAEWGKKCYPLNIYGSDSSQYRPFPEIGDIIRNDGLMYALRDYDDALAGLDMTNEALRDVDFVHDTCTYGKSNAEVFDVTVHTTTNEGRRSHHTPSGMETMAERYSAQHSRYYEEILEAYEEIKRVTRGEYKLTPMLSNLIVMAKGDKPNVTIRRLEEKRRKKNSIIKTWRANPIDEWRVEVFYSYKFPIGEGCKLSDRHGGKGVACRYRPKAEMPVDKYGNVVDVIVYAKGSVGRLNPGQFYEHYINACSRDITLDMKEMVKAGNRQGAIDHILTYLSIISPTTYAYIDHDNREELEDLVDRCCMYGVYTCVPSDDPDIGLYTYIKLEAFRPPNKSTLTYTNGVGKVVTTKEPILVGEKDMIVLDKLDHKPMSVSGIRRQHHGFPAVENKGTKYSTPSKEQPPKIIGESEARTGTAVMGGEAVAELLDVTTNPETHRRTAAMIFEADSPVQIPDIVDRDAPYIRGRPMALLKHTLNCAGIDIVTDKGK